MSSRDAAENAAMRDWDRSDITEKVTLTPGMPWLGSASRSTRPSAGFQFPVAHLRNRRRLFGARDVPFIFPDMKIDLSEVFPKV